MTNKSLTSFLPPLIFSFFLSSTCAAAGASFSETGPDAAAYGAAEGYPPGPRTAPLPQAHMVGTFSHFAEKYPHRAAARPATPSPLRRAAEVLALSYVFGGQTRDMADYLNRHPATGLLIARGDTILFEQYQYARTDQDQFMSQSMAKTITAMLVGIAVAEGAIGSIGQPAADYVPTLAGTEYGKTPVRALLRMASGVAFHEVYDGTGDNARLKRMLFGPANPGPAQGWRYSTRGRWRRTRGSPTRGSRPRYWASLSPPP